ncbi:hypothetical protein EYR40_006240 [Pleurotus pulmonarius]|nr:hypothetical protein EYR36_010861 [Pleurotus pulmonarius]KAF4599150.1 hypothetical protein EYR40_006240 [Pleurotus pulmonarius]
MSNKIVPAIYRAVIDDVIHNIKNEFEEFGVSEEVLAELQHKWEKKVIESHVAEFETTAPPPAQQYAPATHHVHMIQQAHPHYGAHNPYAPMPAPNGQAPQVKAEPVDSRYILGGPQGVASHYALPPLPGPTLNGARPAAVHPGGHQSVLSFPPGPPPVQQQPQAPAQPSTAAAPRAYNAPAPAANPAQPAAAPRIPQTDGPSDSSDDSPSPPQSYAPRSSHPSLPQPSTSQNSVVDSEAINSDLDDSDTEGEDDADEGTAGDTDIVFCTYDKVARVKNKWKCILKDGMIHINGKDYLFARCTGEFEW